MIFAIFARHACKIDHGMPELDHLLKIGDLVEIVGRKYSEQEMWCYVCKEHFDAGLPACKIRTEQDYVCWALAVCMEICEEEFNSFDEARASTGVPRRMEHAILPDAG